MISHKMLARWYQQLSQHSEVGVPLAEAIAAAAGPPLPGRLQLSQQIEAGLPLEAVLAAAPGWLPQADRVFISAGHASGRLKQTFSTLSQRHSLIGANLAKVVLSLIYPLGILHMAALALPLMQMIDFEVGFQWDPVRYLSLCLVLLLPCWALIALIIFLIKTQNPLLPRLMRMIPLLWRYNRTQGMADFSGSLGALLQTGMDIAPAWQRAIQISHSPQLRQAYRSIAQVIDRGEDPSDCLQDFSVFPADFVSYYKTGAKTGKLDETLLAAGNVYQAQANQAMTFAAIVYPILLFAAVAALITYSIFKMYGGYLDMLMQMME